MCTVDKIIWQKRGTNVYINIILANYSCSEGTFTYIKYVTNINLLIMLGYQQWIMTLVYG